MREPPTEEEILATGALVSRKLREAGATDEEVMTALGLVDIERNADGQVVWRYFELLEPGEETDPEVLAYRAQIAANLHGLGASADEVEEALAMIEIGRDQGKRLTWRYRRDSSSG